jgi:hypothetical protein
MDMILKMAEFFFENFTFNLSNAYNFYTHVYFVYFENVNRFQFFFKRFKYHSIYVTHMLNHYGCNNGCKLCYIKIHERCNNFSNLYFKMKNQINIENVWCI